jgi:uncharacterized protein involved in exopolysaccharide biosynthesis/Mrp family chromosome partitioning ATPase
MEPLIRSNLQFPVTNQERWMRQWSLRDVLTVLFRHLKVGVLFFTLIMTAVIAILFSMKDVYQSEAKLLLRLGRESVALDPTILSNNIANVSRSRSNEINSELEILQSADLMENLVKAIGPSVISTNADASIDPSQLTDLALEQLHENLTFQAVKDSNVIVMDYKHANPETAQKVLSEAIKLYLDKHITVHQATGSYEFLQEQESQHRQRLLEIEKKLKNLKDNAGIFSLDEQRNLLNAQISSRQAQLEDSRRDIASLTAKIDDLRAALDLLPETLLLQQSTGDSNASSDALQNRLYELQLKKQELKTKYKRETSEIRDLEGQIALTKQLLSKSKSGRVQIIKGLNENRQQIELDLIEAKSNIAAQQSQAELLERQISSAQLQLDTWNKQEELLEQLERERVLNEAIYHKYAESLEQARVDSALEREKISNISVVQQPTLPTMPTGPHSSWILLAGLIASLFAAFGAIFLRELLDDTIQTPERAEAKLGLPVFASFPKHVMLGALAKFPVFPGKEESAKSDNIQQGIEELRCQLLHILEHNSHKHYRIIGVTSCLKDSGVTTVATKLALAIAQKGDTEVLLVDGNLENPEITRKYALSNRPGLTDILVSRDLKSMLTEKRFGSGLHLLPAGLPVSKTSMQASSFATWLDGRPEQPCKYIIIDLPVIQGFGLSANMAGLCDAVVFVIDAPRSRWQRTRRAIQDLASVNSGFVGVLLNKRNYPIPDWLYRRL